MKWIIAIISYTIGYIVGKEYKNEKSSIKRFDRVRDK